ncbi:MAG: hypothetical protein ACRDBG_26280 [Waterburya sp.]
MSLKNIEIDVTLHDTIIPCLENNGYQPKSHVTVGPKPNGDMYKIDILAVDPKHQKVLVSFKSHRLDRELEETLPYEIIKLIHTIKHSKSKFKCAYIVDCSGWTLKEWYLSGALKEYLEYDGLVEIVSLDEFITLANKKKL